MNRSEQAPLAERSSHLLQAALTYAEHGWPIFPLQGKIPFKGSGGYKDATRDEQRIHTWWRHHPTANIGLATGAVSGVIVIDIDPRHKGHLSIEALEKRYEPLPKTRTSRTAHGGLHRFYQHPHDGETYPNAVQLDGLSGIDVRSDGGYVVLPPSKLYGKLSYKWGNLDLPIAPSPAWLLTLLTQERQQKQETPQGGRFALAAGEKWLDEAKAKANEGNRNSIGFWLACQLRDDGLSEKEAEEVLRFYTRSAPQGKTAYTEKEALASLKSAYSRPARDKARRTRP